MSGGPNMRKLTRSGLKGLESSVPASYQYFNWLERRMNRMCGGIRGNKEEEKFRLVFACVLHTIKTITGCRQVLPNLAKMFVRL